MTARPAADATARTTNVRGSLIAYLISQAFERVETLNPDADHRYYTQCKLCGGTDKIRDHYKSTTAAVQHGGACSLAENLAWLRSLPDAHDDLVAALRPFADLLGCWTGFGYDESPDDEVVRSVGIIGRDHAFITVGDLRRAQAALAKATQPTQSDDRGIV